MECAVFVQDFGDYWWSEAMKNSVAKIKKKNVKTQENLQSPCPLRSNTGPICVRISEDRQ